jgi:hypothetical protein
MKANAQAASWLMESVCRPTHEDKVQTYIGKPANLKKKKCKFDSSVFDTNAMQDRLATFFETNGPSCTAEVSHGNLPFDGSDSLSESGRTRIYRFSKHLVRQESGRSQRRSTTLK